MKLTKEHKKHIIGRLAQANVLAAFLLCLTLVGVSIGFMTSTDGLQNKLNCGNNVCEIVETFGEYDSFTEGQTYEKRVQVKNTGRVDCYVRVFAEVEDPEVRKSLSIDFNETDWTTKQADGYYYYKGILKPGETSSPLFASLKANEYIDDFRMICYCETVQVDGSRTAIEAFAEIR